MHDDLIARLAASPATIARLVSTATGDAAARPSADEWSVAEIVGHIRAADAIWRPRILLALAADRPAIDDVDERVLQRVLDAARLGLDEQVRAFSLGRAELAAALRALDTDQWRRTVTHAERGEMTLTELCAALADHEEEHLGQLAETAAPADAPVLDALGDELSLGEEVLGGLLDRAHRLRADEVPAAVRDVAKRLGARDAEVLLVDMDQRSLALLGDGAVVLDRLDIDGTVAGRAFRAAEPHEVGGDRWIPMLDGADRVGVLHAMLPADPDDALRARLGRLGSISAELVVTKSSFSDALVLARRTKPMTLAAELRWALLPPLTFRNDVIEVAGMLVPTHEVAGDAFDYSVGRDIAYAALFDAMGHGLEAARMANLALAAFRHGRRLSLELTEIAEHIDRVLADQFGFERFVTGLLVSIDVASGSVRMICAGHPLPLLLRGRRVINQVDAFVNIPFGLGLRDPVVAELALEAGDRLLLFTDGVTEARAESGEPFGVERVGELLTRAAMADELTAETVRRLTHSVLAHASELTDDATLLLLGWRTS